MFRAKAASATGKAKAQALYELGCRLAAAGEYELALEELIEAAEGDQALLTGPAREAMIQVFHALGDAHPVTQDYRSRLMMLDRKSTRLNSSHVKRSRMPSSA